MMRQKSLLLSFALIAITCITIKAMQVYYFTGRPKGNYVDSCRNIKVELTGEGLDLKRKVTAECKDEKGKWKKTSIIVNALNNSTEDYQLENRDGKLQLVQLP